MVSIVIYGNMVILISPYMASYNIAISNMVTISYASNLTIYGHIVLLPTLVLKTMRLDMRVLIHCTWR
jgi:hypothetical protein